MKNREKSQFHREAKKPKLLLISPGPKFNLEYSFADRCAGLSENYTGVILTSGPEEDFRKFGNFDVFCIGDKNGHSLSLFFRFIFHGLKLLSSRNAKGLGPEFDLIATYDPLKTGLIACILSFFSKIPFAVEVNGDYTADVLYWHIKNPITRKLRKKLLYIVEKFVLNRASGIKLLYDDQIDAFLPLRKNSVVMRFPDYVNTTLMKNIEEEKVVLFVGFPLYVKGVDILIEAFKRLSPRFPHWKLKILGFFSDLKELEALIDGHPKIFHHPPVDPSEIPEHIGRCGIFVLPSRTEAMGRVLIEAMACGKPRVGSRVGGIPTVINDRVDGLLCNPGDRGDLQAKLTTLLTDGELRTRLGSAGHERYLREFGRDNYFLTLSEYYRTVISCSF